MRRLHLGSYASYGFASIGTVGAEMLIQLYLFDFYVRLLGLSPFIAGCAFGIAIIWDALSDLIIARLLFATRKRGILYTSIIALGSMILASSIFFLFQSNPDSSQLYLFIQLTSMYVIVNTGMTLIDLPQSSLSAELSDKMDERNRLLGSKLLLGIIGLVIGSALPGLFLEGETVDTMMTIESRTKAALVLSFMIIFTGLVTFFGLKRRDKEIHNGKPVVIPKWKDVLSLRHNQAYMNIIYASVIAAVGRTVNAAMALIYYRLVLNLSEQTVTQYILPIFTLAIIVSVPIWIVISKKFGNERPAWIAVTSLGIMGLMTYPFLPKNELWPVLIVSVVGGFLSAAVFLVDSMVTKLIDTDEIETGSRKEALYFAGRKSVVKIARAIAFVIIGVTLGVFGLEAGVEAVDRSTEWLIIMLFGVFVGASFILSGYFLKKVHL